MLVLNSHPEKRARICEGGIMRGLAIALLVVATAAACCARTGMWLDEVVFVSQPDHEQAIDQIVGGNLHFTSYPITMPREVESITADDLPFGVSYGNRRGLYLNFSADPSAGASIFSSGAFNPFALRPVREAMNYLLDRQHIALDLMCDTAIPLWSVINNRLRPYEKVARTVRSIELRYAYDLAKAEEMIASAMKAAGAVWVGDTSHMTASATGTPGAEYVSNTWHYEGSPVEVTLLIRRDDERGIVGDYISDQLEAVGFRVQRQYVGLEETVQTFAGDDPVEGVWSGLTEGWGSHPSVQNPEVLFTYYYTDSPFLRQSADMQAFTMRFLDVAQRLELGEFSSLGSYYELIQEAEEAAIHSSTHVWLYKNEAVWPHSDGASAVFDLSSGFNSPSWAFTTRFIDVDGSSIEGGTAGIACNDVVSPEYRPYAGSLLIQYAAESWPTYPDPYSGLALPNWVDDATVTVDDGLAEVQRTLDWVTLETASEIEVPEDAWVDWDAGRQVFVTRVEARDADLTAMAKATIACSHDLFDNSWHDGSKLSEADFVMAFIHRFDRAKSESPYYSANATSEYCTFRSKFRGLRILSHSPLVYEVYLDQWYRDAESIAAACASLFWPSYAPLGQGEPLSACRTQIPWQVVAAALLGGESHLEFHELVDPAVAETLLERIEAFSAGCGTEAGESAIPYYSGTLCAYLDADEVRARGENAKSFVSPREHLFIGLGPMMLESIDTVAQVAVGKRFADYKHENAWNTGFGPRPRAEINVVYDHTEEKVVFDDPRLNERLEFYRDHFIVHVTDENGLAHPEGAVEQVAVVVHDTAGNFIDSYVVSLDPNGEVEVTCLRGTSGQVLVTLVGTAEVATAEFGLHDPDDVFPYSADTPVGEPVFPPIAPVEGISRFDDVRWSDLSCHDLSDHPNLISTLWYNQDTMWPDVGQLPPGCDPLTILDEAKNPGLGIRELHARGITGAGVNVAIIDQPMYLNHPEFVGKVVAYHDVGCDSDHSMHGPAVTSLLVGTNCGTAPDAMVYYVAVPSWKRDTQYEAEALDWIVEQNEKLPLSEKIRVVSVSACPTCSSVRDANRDMWMPACARAEAAGIMVLDCTGERGFISCSYLDSAGPERVSRCAPGDPRHPTEPGFTYGGEAIFVPSAPRTTAEQYSEEIPAYQYCGTGGRSWTIPYCAGVLALGWQIRPNAEPSQMRDLLFASAYTTCEGAKIIDPAEFIRFVEELD